MKCHRCKKRSTYSADYRKNHYGGDHSYDEWITNPLDPSLHRQYGVSAGKRDQIDKKFFFEITSDLDQMTKFTSILLRNFFFKKK